jgi:hypothetical protein
MKTKNRIMLALGVACMTMVLESAAEVGYALRSIDLKAKPYLDADTLAKLQEKAEVEILSRNGPWMLVKTRNKQTGYVRLLQVRLGVTATSADPGGWLPPAGVETAASRPITTAVVTTGVRGFSEEDLKAAKPNKAEYDKMKSFAANAGQASAFAAQAQLVARILAYYDEAGKPMPGAKK